MAATKNRRFHPWWEWECYRAGFYETSPPIGMSRDRAKKEYAEFLRDLPRFEAALSRVLNEWPTSCEQFLGNANINRIAWLGQAAMCIDCGVPSFYKSGFQALTSEEKQAANALAKRYLDKWLEANE